MGAWQHEAEGIRTNRIVNVLCDFEKPFKLLSLSHGSCPWLLEGLRPSRALDT